MLRRIAEDKAAYVFWSSKLKDDQPRSCKFCGEIFFPGQQPEFLEGALADGWGWWRRTCCGSECAFLMQDFRRRKRRTDSENKTGSSGRPDRHAVFERDGYVCYLCGSQTDPVYKGTDRRLKPQIDHVIPLSGGGLNHFDNVRCCCGRCNPEKGSKTLPQAIRISSCGDIDFDSPTLPAGRPTLEELVSAWRQWVLPSISDEPEVQVYVDRQREEAWTSIYLARVANLEKLVADEPNNTQGKDDLTLSYIGFSRFLQKYGRHREAVEIHRKRLAICENLSATEPGNRIWQYGLADTLFELGRAGEDVQDDISRLRGNFDHPFVERVVAIVLHLVEVARRRTSS
jgi:5-methylcytosine-specific restriction endonuclease McrA